MRSVGLQSRKRLIRDQECVRSPVANEKDDSGRDDIFECHTLAGIPIPAGV